MSPRPAPGTPGDLSVPWRALFGNDRPVEVEIGSGRGRFLCAAAARHPDHNFFGLEQGAALARVAGEAIRTAGLTNARVLQCDARCVVHHLIPARSVGTYHLYFPDPWWKRRHRKRRLCTPSFAADLAHTLEPGGRILVATDVSGLFDAIVRAFACGGLVPDDPPELDPHTHFATRCRAVDRPVHQVAFVHALPAQDHVPPGPTGRAQVDSASTS